MRNKNTNKAINDLVKFADKKLKFKDLLHYCISDLEKLQENVREVFAYILELEKRDKAVLVYFDKEGNPIEYINKQIIRDKIKKIDDDGIWITEDYYYNEELGDEYPIAQSNFSKEEMEDIVVDILKSIIGE